MSWGIEYTATLFRHRKDDLESDIEDKTGYLENLKQQLLILCTINKKEIEYDINDYDDVIDYIGRRFNSIMEEIEEATILLQRMYDAKADEDSIDA